MRARVLVTAAGGIIAQGIIKALKLANASSGPVDYHIVGVDMSPLSAGLYRCDQGIIVPPADSSQYVDNIVQICKDQDIDALFVGSDDELLILAKAKERIEHESNSTVIVGSFQALAIGRDKWETYQFCKKAGIDCPQSSLVEDSDELLEKWGYPVIVKPTTGYGSREVYCAKNRDEVSYAISAINACGWRPMLQRYVPGAEYTSGITVEKAGRYVISSIAMQKMIKQGQTHKAVIDDFRPVRRAAETVALKLGTCGPVNVQARLDQDGKPLLIEINPRFSASCPMRAVAGINEPDVAFRNIVLGEELKKIDTYKSLVCLRYWNEVYVPRMLFDKASIDGVVDHRGDDSFIPPYF
jgi:carbamoyl-phosphate synthase large subunit